MTFTKLLTRLDRRHDVRGTQFERLCKWFLENAPEYRPLIRRVWLWRDWPQRWEREAGIDLVAETHAGELWAIQAKAYNPSYYIKKADVDSFLSESSRQLFSFRLLIASTDNLGPTALRTIRAQEKPVDTLLRSRLEAANVVWPRDLVELRPSRAERKYPLVHQQEATDAVEDGFRRSDLGQLIMACGTGKTLVGLWISERVNAERTLVLVPSLTLLAQTLREWTANTTDSFDYLAVCSDDTVAEHDAVVASTAELGVPVTTDPEAIRLFLQRRGRRVVFATYQSSERIATAQKAGAPRLDLTIADEAHRCAGLASGGFATVLDARKIRSRRRLFMTATPRYITGRVKRATVDADVDIASMDDKALFGPVFHTLSFGEAIRKDLLSDYRVVVVGVDDPTIMKYVERREIVTPGGRHVTDARTLAAHIALAKAMREYDLRRIISFHNRVSNARAFTDAFPTFVEWMPQGSRPTGRLWCEHVNGKMPSGRRDSLLREFGSIDDDARAMISNARCLAEGVDVPTIDGIGFIEPRRATTDVIQAVGRAIRKSENKSVGTIVLPVFISPGTDPTSALSASSFRAVWGVLRALRAHDDVLAEELDVLRRRLGKDHTRVSLRLPNKIILDLPMSVRSDFADAFKMRLVEQTSARWEEWCGVLEAFVDREGHARVPQGQIEASYPLGTWAQHQRQFARAGTLSAERRGYLGSLRGWTWDPHADKWQEQFEALRRYAIAHQHSQVPASFRDHTGLQLGSFVNRQRRRHKTGRIEPYQAELLGALPGWSWEPYEDSFNVGYAAAEQYAAENGHLLVDKSYKTHEGFELGKWLGVRRSKKNQEQLSPGRIGQLTAIGMVWDLKAFRWETRFRELKDHIARQATLPAHGKSPLGNWVSVQRKRYLRQKLEPERAIKLESLGSAWIWDIAGDIQSDLFRALLRFVEENGHADVPSTYRDGRLQLGVWIHKLRTRHTKGALKPELEHRLEAMNGWSWELRAVRKGWKSYGPGHRAAD